jgi:peptidoglycan hydrolase-like protein with peptidoglycan-binding domain
VARLIDGLAVLRAEFDKINPKRDRSSDGWIGDDRHAAIASDHNPDRLGVVRAIDVDVDGVPMGRIVAHVVNRCRSGAEKRLQYVIYRRTIWSRSWGWKAKKYLGANPHIRHAHFSARAGDVAGSTTAWGIAGAFSPRAARPAAKPGAHLPGSRLLEVRSPELAGADVAFVQQWIGERRCGPADGRYGPKTLSGVRWYQGMRGLDVDGVVGPATWRHMGVRWTGGRGA